MAAKNQKAKTATKTNTSVKSKTSTKNTNTKSQGRPMPGGKAPKRNRKESDFFYVNKKLPCFLLFVCFLLIVAVVAINIIPALVPSLAENDIIKLALSFTSVYRVMDETPMDEREEAGDSTGEEGEEGETGYVDQTVYITMGDLLMGSINNLTGKYDAEGDATEGDGAAEAEELPTEEGAEGEESTEAVSGTPFYDEYKAKEKASGYTEGIALTLVAYAPLAIAVLLVIALINMLKAFLALFGKRVYKRFGLAAIICIICAVAVMLVGVGMVSLHSSVETGAETLSFDIGRIVDILTSAFETAPETAAEAAEMAAEVAAEGEEVVVKLPFQANYGLLIITVLPVVCLVLSFAAKKKIPYAIFD